jgi:AAA15 family ATPase/GTPase
MDTSSLKNLRPIDILGLKNFRVFDDKDGFMEELSAINILTGANNSGKSSIVKALQMLRNSLRDYKYPFNLDLNQQEHLLGDFDNILFNKKDRNLVITLPYLFMGMKNFSIALTFESSNSTDTYDARLRGIEVIDKTDSKIIFSFHYMEATDEERNADIAAYNEMKEEFKRKDAENAGKDINIFNAWEFYNQEPFEDFLRGYVEWTINFEKFKHYISELRQVYEIYLKDKAHWTGDSFKMIDEVAEEMYVLPSSFIRCFQKDADMNNWKDFLDSEVWNDPEERGKVKVGERDFDADDYLLPRPEIEHVLFYKASEILNAKLNWVEQDDAGSKYSVVGNCFSISWESLLQRISTVNYVSNIKEENSRSYNAGSNSPFVRLLKSYVPEPYYGPSFLIDYLKAFEIGKAISVSTDPKYQSIRVSITTLGGEKRELVDFGYGIKQLVLILMQISVLAQKNLRQEHVYDYEGESIHDTYVPSLLIIEEPESNLHPKWQSLLADMFAEASSKFNIQMIIETHSEYLIRKFQTLVAEKKMSAHSVKIFYLRGGNRLATGKKQVESLRIQDDGSIDFTIFDHGFFDENYTLTMGLLNVQREKFMQDFEALKKNNKESEEKVIELQQRVDAYTDKVDVAKYRQILDLRFDTTKLDAGTLTYLVSGQYLLENIDVSGDYSPVIIQYGRAIENELKRIFVPINSTEQWVLGPMQGTLEKFKGISTTMGACKNVDYVHVPAKLGSMFHNPLNLKVEMLNDLRLKRNDVGHAGHTMTKQDAIDYIQDSGVFLDIWIAELK